jgi:phenylacetate-CoA ligase
MHPQQVSDLWRMYRLQRRPPAQIRQIRENKLRDLLRHAYTKVPYYRELFDAEKLKPDDIRTLDDLAFLPMTSRACLQELDLEEKTAEGTALDRCRVSSTSGTTGIPLSIYLDRRDASLMGLAWARAFMAGGMKPWYRTAAFIGREEVKTRKSWYEHFGIWRRLELSSGWDPAQWISRLQAWKPEVIVGYVMTLKILAEHIQKHRIMGIHPELVFHSSAVLDSHSRSELESVFKCRIVDVYGSDEAGCIAWECAECGGYHVSEDMVIVEIVKDGRPVPPGESGEVVITNLFSRAMPFIRYRQGDVCRLLDKVPVCGRTFTLLDKIAGRTDDFIVLPGGQKISPHPLYHCIDPVSTVRRWRLVQESTDSVYLEIEPGEGYGEESESAIRSCLARILGEAVRIQVSLVETMAVDPYAKFRAVSSKVREMDS